MTTEPMTAGPAAPRHVAIIMDGNGRWAERQGLPRNAGHRAGVNAVREALEGCGAAGVQYLTLFSFSSENWRRSEEEVTGLMRLLCETIAGEVEGLVDRGIRLRHIGEREALPAEAQAAIAMAEDRTRQCTGPTLCLALNYGSRGEIVRAIKSIASDVASGDLPVESIDESLVSDRLFTAGIPDPDLLIRTAGEMRISNFLLWQISYAELYVTETLWPDFTREDFADAVRQFGQRERRYGGVPSSTAASPRP